MPVYSGVKQERGFMTINKKKVMTKIDANLFKKQDRGQDYGYLCIDPWSISWKLVLG